MAVNRNRSSSSLKSKTNKCTRIILDTNFLFVPIQFGVNIFEEFQRIVGNFVKCIVLSVVIDELMLLRNKAAPSFRRDVEFVLSLASKCKIVTIEHKPERTIDEAIYRFAMKSGYPVATNDSELRKRLKDKGIPVIYVRQRTHLEIDGFI